MRKLVTILAVLLLSGTGLFFFTKKDDKTSASPSPSSLIVSENKNVDIKAGFAIFTNGTYRIFSDKKYHNLSQEVYIESQNPNIVVVKNAETTWGDFFKTLPMKLEKDCLTTGTGQLFCTGESGELKFYINNTQNQDALTKKISNGDKLLVTFGSKESNLKYELSQIPDPN